jgi:hypothetical protein
MPIVYLIRTDKKLQMIKDSDINAFIESLSSHLRVLINRISEKETWSTDDHDDVRILINELSGLLDKTDEKLLLNASHLLLSNSAYFSLPRFLRFFALMSEKNPEMIQQILNPMNAQLIPDGSVFLSTVINRLRYVVQSILIKEIFEPETVERIYQSVLSHEKEMQAHKETQTEAESEVLASPDSKLKKNDISENNESINIDLSGDDPFVPEDKDIQVENPPAEPQVKNQEAPELSTANSEGASILLEKIQSKGNSLSATKGKTVGESIKVEDVLSIIQEMTGQTAVKNDEE